MVEVAGMPTAIKKRHAARRCAPQCAYSACFFLQIALSITDAPHRALVAELHDGARNLTIYTA
jgi:hypothetical protein